MSERSSPIVSRRANCRQHQAAGNVPSKCLCDNKTSCIAVTANKGEPEGKPFISTASLTIHTCLSCRNRASCHCDSHEIRDVHLLIQSIAGTVMASARVEIKSIEALSDSSALYRAANSSTTVARGKLQHTSASRANGLATCKMCSRANRTADCTVTRAKEPANTTGESRTGCAARTRPTANTATPEVAEPISSKQLVITAGKWIFARTKAIPRIGPHKSGDFRPALSPVTIGFGFE